MDTKEKKPRASRPGAKGNTGARGRKPAQQTVRRPAPARTADSEQTPRRVPPQGAGMHAGAGRTGSARPAGKTYKPPRKQNALQKLVGKGIAAAEKVTSGQERLRKAQRQAVTRRKRNRGYVQDTPAVIYTEPKPFSRRRFLVQMFSVIAIVLALVMGISVFFKVKTITVSGAETYSPWAVREASGIQEGDQLLGFSVARASAQILTELSYVEKVRIGIKLPDTVNIYIEELDVAYAIKSQDGIWWLMTSEGRIVEQANAAIAEGYTKVLGVTLDAPVVGADAVPFEELSTETAAEGETVPVTVTARQRLSAALQILKALEANDIVGEAASVNVTSLNAIELWYGTRYQVNLGDINRMEYKIACMNEVILELHDYQTGMLDISFTTWADQVGYTPFTS